MNKYYAALMCAAAISLFSCKKESGDININQPGTQPIAPSGFNFSTTKEVLIDVKLLTNDNQPLGGVLVNVYASLTNNNGKSLLSALSASDGSVKATISIPAYLDTLYIDPAYIGLMRNAKAVINNNNIVGVIGGDNGFSGDFVANDGQEGVPSANATTDRQVTERGTTTTKYDYMGYYDWYGRPYYLASQSDVISSSLLSYINASLPEGKPAPTYHPDYLNTNAENNINIVKKTDVWITFVSEGAGYTNSLAYYTYPTSTPPASAADIDSIHIILPNASLNGAGGNMRSGDKVYLGRFAPGVSIGYVLLQNAWNSSTLKVTTTATKFYTQDELNTAETNSSMTRHAVTLYDSDNKLFVTGFEDQTRSTGNSDNDFNDLVFYTTTNVIESVSTSNINPIDKPTDTDGDGVSDVYDRYPKDAARAYIQYYPAETTWGTLAYEDQWPSTGDYDVNDMVIGYRYKYVKNAQNNIVEMYGDYALRAIGASFINGFGVQLPIAYSKVKTVTGQRLIGNYITTNANGTEAGQTNAVIIPFDDTRALYANGGFLSVVTGGQYAPCDTAHVYVGFTSALTSADFAAGAYNPFLISNKRRGYEVHLSGYQPTDKANKSLFGTAQDNSSISTNRYYLSAQNWPWALGFVEDFDYPTETNNVSTAYLNFLDWAQSGGSKSADWYTDKSGNRNSNAIFKKNN